MAYSKRQFMTQVLAVTAGAWAVEANAFSLLSRPLPTGGAYDSSPVINAQAQGLVPNSQDDQSAAFQDLLDLASQKDAPIFLPGGVYKVGQITLPIRTRIVGVQGSTRLTFAGRSHLMRGERADLIHIHGVVFDGLGVTLSEKGPGLLTADTVRDLRITNCDFVGSAIHGLDITGCAGRITGCHFRSVADAAVFAKQSRGLTVSDNTISDCGNGGILIHRFTPGTDGSVVANNRIEGVKATNGGTGQWGNGINVFQAHDVMVANNRIADCAFSAVRINGAHNVQITGNHCRRSGETAVYAEFTFQGALIANNLVDGGTIGISLANFNEGGRLATVSGNVIRNLSNVLPYENPTDFKPGIGIYAEADTVISANVIESAPQAGIHIGWGEFCRNVIASDNIIRSVPWGITASVVDGARSVVIRDNIFDEIGKQAVTGFRWIEPATDELVGARKTGFDHLTVEGNRIS